MPMTIYKLRANDNGDSVASLDIQIDGIITAIYMTGKGSDVNAQDDGWMAETSFLSSNSFGVNDVRGSLMIIQSELGALTSGGLNTAVNANISSMEIPVAAGERIHMHILKIGTTGSCTVHAYLYVLDKGTPRIPGRRR